MTETPSKIHEPPEPEPEQELNQEPVLLQTNERLKQLIERIQATPIDWDSLYSQLDEATNYAQVSGKLAELHLQGILEAAAEESEGAINLNPIPDHTQTANFCFRKLPFGGMYATNLSHGKAIAQYDFLTEIDGLPVIWEVKTAKTKTVKSKNLTPESVESRLTPLREYYNNNKLGYVIVLANDVIGDNSILGNNFKESGGHITHLPISREEFMVQGIRFKYRSRLQ